MKPTLSVTECVGFGWRTFKSRPWFFVEVTLSVMLLQIVIGVLQHSLGNALGFIVSFVLGGLLYSGMLHVYIKAHDNLAETTLSNLWYPKPLGHYLLLSVLAGVIVGIGFVLLIVPGIILALMFFASGYLVIGEGMSATAALKESMRLTKGHRWKLLLLCLASLGLMILGIIPLLLGLFVATPVIALAGVHAFKTLRGA